MLELIAALLIISILVAIASSSYLTFIRKSRRTDGTTTLLSIQLAQEKHRATNPTYGTLTQIWNSNTSPQGYYALSIAGVSDKAYVLSAQAQGDQVNDKESGVSCATLTITVNGLNDTKAPAACWK